MLFLYLKILLILGTANFLPILARMLLKDKFATPVDMGILFMDNRRLFGPHKTWRGILFSIAGTSIFSSFLGFHPITGMKIAFFSMMGDLTASFIKRRMGLASGAKATGIDQVIEAALPLVILKNELVIDWPDIIIVVIIFSVAERILSVPLYKLGIRRNPH